MGLCFISSFKIYCNNTAWLTHKTTFIFVHQRPNPKRGWGGSAPWMGCSAHCRIRPLQAYTLFENAKITRELLVVHIYLLDKISWQILFLAWLKFSWAKKQKSIKMNLMLRLFLYLFINFLNRELLHMYSIASLPLLCTQEQPWKKLIISVVKIVYKCSALDLSRKSSFWNYLIFLTMKESIILALFIRFTFSTNSYNIKIIQHQ